jgi:acetoin utilization deacetylase AcuC-like enzyme
MNSFVDKLLEVLRRTFRLALRYFYVGVHCTVKILKIQLQKLKKRGAQRRLESAYSGLGAEIYSLSKHGEADWQKMPSVQQQIKLVEEAELTVFHSDEVVEEIKSAFQNKKEELKEKYAFRPDETVKKQSEES